MKTIISFVAGTAVGALVTYFICKDRTKQKIQDGINEGIDKYRKANGLDKDEVEEAPIKAESYTADKHIHSSLEKPDIEKYKSIVEETYGESSMIVKEKEIDVISHDEYESGDPGYAKRLLTMYDDGVVADDLYDVVDDEQLKAMLGTSDPRDLEMDSESDDVIYVQNNALRCYYELVKDPRTYEEASSRIGYLHHLEDDD